MESDGGMPLKQKEGNDWDVKVNYRGWMGTAG